MTEMLISGFPVARNAANAFPGLGADKVAIGLCPPRPRRLSGRRLHRPGDGEEGARLPGHGTSGYANTYKLRSTTGYPDCAAS